MYFRKIFSVLKKLYILKDMDCFKQLTLDAVRRLPIETKSKLFNRLVSINSSLTYSMLECLEDDNSLYYCIYCGRYDFVELFCRMERIPVQKRNALLIMSCSSGNIEIFANLIGIFSRCNLDLIGSFDHCVDIIVSRNDLKLFRYLTELSIGRYLIVRDISASAKISSIEMLDLFAEACGNDVRYLVNYLPSTNDFVYVKHLCRIQKRKNFDVQNLLNDLAFGLSDPRRMKIYLEAFYLDPRISLPTASNSQLYTLFQEYSQVGTEYIAETDAQCVLTTRNGFFLNSKDCASLFRRNRFLYDMILQQMSMINLSQYSKMLVRCRNLNISVLPEHLRDEVSI